MAKRPRVVRRLLLVLIAGIFSLIPLWSQAETGRARIALFTPAGTKTDVTLIAVLDTMADSVELSLACLELYEVRRLPAADPVREMGRVRAYCQDNRIDQAIVGSGSARREGGYTFRLAVYDRRSDSVTVDKEGVCRGALDMFDTADALVESLLDGLSGTHLLFGSLIVDTDPAGAFISVNGKDVGAAPVTLRGLPVGVVRVAARRSGREQADSSVTILDGETARASLTLARSMGSVELDMPADAVVSIRAAGMEEKLLRGSTSEELPTGAYQVEASCPGLESVRQLLTIQRNETSRWVPWEKGYLDVQSDPPDARVVVDGVERGTAPLVVEVEPGVSHRVELIKDKYEHYRADLIARAARKVSFRQALIAKPGSIRVETTPVAAIVSLDGEKMLTTPCTFLAVSPGPHTISIPNVLAYRRYYTSQHTYAVEVNPDESATVSAQLVPATATLQIVGAPPSGTVFIEGTKWNPGQEVPAGTLDIVISTPSSQMWKKTLTLGPGGTIQLRMDSFVASLLRRVIKVDGKVDDWNGIEPLWGGVREQEDRYGFYDTTSRTEPFPNQTGTRLASAWLCRDDSKIYVRLDFDDGLPSQNLSKDIKGTLMRSIHFVLPGEKMLEASVASNRGWGTNAEVSLWDVPSHSKTNLGMISGYAAAGSTLEIAISLNRVEKYLSAGPVDVNFSVSDGGITDWYRGYSTYNCPVDFMN
jgi:hypothetical protein